MSAIRSLVVACAGRSASLRSASAGVTGARWTLADVGFEVPGGVLVMVTGRNGSGKSTLLRVLATAIRAGPVPVMVVLDPMGQLRPWATLMVIFDVIHWSIGGLFFARILED